MCTTTAEGAISPLGLHLFCQDFGLIQGLDGDRSYHWVALGLSLRVCLRPTPSTTMTRYAGGAGHLFCLVYFHNDTYSTIMFVSLSINLSAYFPVYLPIISLPVFVFFSFYNSLSVCFSYCLYFIQSVLNP